MSARDRLAFHTGINSYVPGMAYSSAMVHSQVTMYSLGSPAAADDDIIAATIDADAVAATIEAYAVTLDATYGRSLQLKVSADPGAASSVIDVYGFDYLGQPVVERFTTANGSTAIQYGKKIFKRITQTKIVTAATNAITAKLGTYTRLGLPYKGDLIWAKENNVLVPIYKRPFTMWAELSDADFTAGVSRFIRAPCPGFVSLLRGIPDGAGSTNDPVATVELGGVAITGLTVTVDTSDATGLEVTDAPTTAGYSANNRFVTGDKIELVSAAAASAGSGSLGVDITPMHFFPPDLTDPATNVTYEPRGFYDPITPPAGVEILIGLVGDGAVNASNNGGLHGLRHYGG